MNEIFALIEGAFSSGLGVIQEEQGSLFHLLFMIALFSMIVSSLIQHSFQYKKFLSWLIVTAGFAVVIDFLSGNMKGLFGAFWEVGLSTSGGATVTELTDFDGLLFSGLALADNFITKVQGWSWYEVIADPWTWLWGWFAAGLLLAMHSLLAFRLFFTMVMWVPLSYVTMIAMVFAAWQPTMFIAEGAFRYVAGFALSILGFAVVLSGLWGASEVVEWGPDMSLGETLIGLSVFGIIAYMAMKVQSVIQDYFSGGMNVSAGGFRTLHTMMMVGSAMRMMGGAMRAAGGGGVGNSGGRGPAPQGPTPTNPSIYGGGPSNAQTGTGGGWRQPNRRGGNR